MKGGRGAKAPSREASSRAANRAAKRHPDTRHTANRHTDTARAAQGGGEDENRMRAECKGEKKP